MEHPLLKNGVVCNEQSSMVYDAMQPTSQYITSVWFIHSITSEDKQFGDVMNSFVQGFIQSHAGQLIIDILTLCHKILSTFHENFLLFLNFDLSVQKSCQKICLMLNCFKHYKHDFNVYISKYWLIETHYNVTAFIVYLENIILPGSAHWKYHEKNVSTAAYFVSRSQNATGSAKVSPVNYN